MESPNFNFWGSLLSFLLFLATCNTSTSIEGHSPELVLPSSEVPQLEDYSSTTTKLALILLSSDKTYVYEGIDTKSGSVMNEQTLQQKIAGAKRKYPPEKFVVIIKLTSGTPYGRTVDALDQMSINKIERHTIRKLTVEERQLLNISDKETY